MAGLLIIIGIVLLLVGYVFWGLVLILVGAILFFFVPSVPYGYSSWRGRRGPP
jgi:uncharacterized membrane protein YccF (DUF307 family)